MLWAYLGSPNSSLSISARTHKRWEPQTRTEQESGERKLLRSCRAALDVFWCVGYSAMCGTGQCRCNEVLRILTSPRPRLLQLRCQVPLDFEQQTNRKSMEEFVPSVVPEKANLHTQTHTHTHTHTHWVPKHPPSPRGVHWMGKGPRAVCEERYPEGTLNDNAFRPLQTHCRCCRARVVC